MWRCQIRCMSCVKWLITVNHPHMNLKVFTEFCTVQKAILLATKQNLYIYNFWPLWECTCKCTCATMGPTRSTVLWYVLIASSTDKVGSIDISPVPGFGQLYNIHIFMRTWNSPEKIYIHFNLAQFPNKLELVLKAKKEIKNHNCDIITLK